MQLLRTRLDLLDTMPKGSVCAEAGVQRGDFASEILTRCAPSKLYLIDIWAQQVGCAYEGDKSNISNDEHERFKQIVTSRFRAEIKSGIVQVIQAHVHVALHALGSKSLDWLYLDADHTREAVTRDLLAADFALGNNGIIAGHDYGTWPHLSIDVKEPVDAFCRDCGWIMTARTLNDASCDGFDSFVLRRQGVTQ